MAAARALLASLAALALCGAHAYTCNDRIKPGYVINLGLTSTSFYNGYSSMNFAWQRPNDGTCIKEYDVAIFRASDGQQLQSARIPVTLDAGGASYLAKGLNAGTPYKIEVRAIGPTQEGFSTGQRGPFTSASASGCQDKTPMQVATSSMYLAATAMQTGTTSSIKFEWNRPNDGSCINGYDVAVFNSGGQQFISANVPVDAVHTKAAFDAQALTPGNEYFFAVTPRSPKAGNGPQSFRAGPFRAAGGVAPGPK